MIKFGTDGWRAVIAEDFTFDNVRACAQGVANYLKQAKLSERGLVIGYDTRFASEDFAAAAAEVIAGNEINVHLCSQPAPTPVISYAVTATQSVGAIIITASHNPGSWNGFKYKDDTGASAPTELVTEIERNTNEILSTGGVKRLPLAEGVDSQVIAYLDPAPAYGKHLERLVGLEVLRRSRLKIIVDSMYGAGIGYFKTLLQGGEIEVIEINSERNPLFPGIQPEPIAKNLTKLSSLIKARKADVGLATDGDADRIGVVDEKGEFLNQHQVFALLALYFLEVCGERGAIIKTLTSTDMLYRLGELFDVPVYETAVGFKYVAPLMMEKDAFIGGEESGGYGFRGHVPERDGILAGLYFLDFMLKTGKTPSQLLGYLYGKVGPHYYDRLDFHISPDEHQTLLKNITRNPVNSIAGIKVTKLDTTDGFRHLLADDSWLLIRFSGTEPLVRIYAESYSPEQVQKLLDSGRKLLGI
ncbi:MAG TPA: phosphoglucomutase/phosphomannomutase family protein [Dehalococcoidia bacterium]|nr:phosphoglucomutase/phosphomannomutase family protein [Dehalococcoidia bacterium]